jgi:hypothetical protein
MSYIHFTDEPNQEERLARLREEVEKLGGNTMALESMPADMEEEFLRHVLEYEHAEPISVFQLLENSGLEIVRPDHLDHENLKLRLRELIDRMASMGAYLMHTDHLSDRALYEYLYHDGLREEAVLFPENPSYAYMIDLVGSGSEEDNYIFLKYYADEKYREQWATDWPDDRIPEREEPPFDRDRFLPQSPVG